MVANTPGAIEPILCAVREKVTDGATHQYLLDPAVRVGTFVWSPTLLFVVLGCDPVICHDSKIRNQVVMKALVPTALACRPQIPATLWSPQASSSLTH